jgi:hypothetical protein
LERPAKASHPICRPNKSSGPFLVELRGLEPLTPSLQRRCSPVLSYSPLPSNYSIIPPVPQEVKAHETLRLPRPPPATTAIRIPNKPQTTAHPLAVRSQRPRRGSAESGMPTRPDVLLTAHHPDKKRGPSPTEDQGPWSCQWAILDLNQRPLPYQRSALAN